jgi:DNA polymerase delta subunit 1
MIRTQITRIIPCRTELAPQAFGPFLRAAEQQNTPLLQMLGRTKEGVAQNWYVAGFEPYFYVAAPPQLREDDLSALMGHLNELCGGHPFKRIELINNLISMDHYHRDPRPLLRLTTYEPGRIAKLRSVWLEQYANRPM